MIEISGAVAESFACRWPRSRHFPAEAVAEELHRAPSTIWREFHRNRGPHGYHGQIADYRARQRARRPKVFTLQRRPALARWFSRLLEKNWSPEQIVQRLRKDHPAQIDGRPRRELPDVAVGLDVAGHHGGAELRRRHRRPRLCGLCDDYGPRVAYHEPVGQVLRLHAACQAIWLAERDRRR